MAHDQEGVPRYFGDLGNLGDDGRLVVPAEVRQAVAWLQGKQPVRLLAELREKGRIRLYPLDQVTSRLDDVRRRILESHSTRMEALAVLGDRFREVSYYPSDTRVRLSPVIATYLKCETSSQQTYYVEARGGQHIDVMTLAIRDERLKTLMRDLELPDS
jgi:bifunctional DNA-binding transcriptional regulator/antitoxin component of YhaV-PrlF toxin-antitoxin module